MNKLRQQAAKFMRVEDMRKYKAQGKTNILSVEKKEVKKVHVHRGNARQMNSNFCPHLMFNFGYLIEYLSLKECLNL